LTYFRAPIGIRKSWPNFPRPNLKNPDFLDAAKRQRPIQLWLPDIRSQKIIDEVRKQSIRVSSDSQDSRITDFVESVMDHEGWE
jgi:hypothetical protein